MKNWNILKQLLLSYFMFNEVVKFLTVIAFTRSLTPKKIMALFSVANKQAPLKGTVRPLVYNMYNIYNLNQLKLNEMYFTM